MIGALEVLQRLTFRVPPPEGKRHNFTLAGPSPFGGVEVLVLSIFTNDKFYNFDLDLSDLHKDPYVLVEEVIDLLQQALREECKGFAG